MYCRMGFNLSLAIYPSKMGTIYMESAVTSQSLKEEVIGVEGNPIRNDIIRNYTIHLDKLQTGWYVANPSQHYSNRG